MTTARDTGATPATRALEAAGIAFTVRTYEHDPATSSFGAEAASALQEAPDRVLKTLVVSCGAPRDGLAVAVVPVSGSLDLKAAARALQVKKVALAEPAAAERSSGYVVGGISPIGQKRALPTIVDDSVLAHATVLVSGGRRGMDIELSPADLLTATGGSVAPVAARS